MSPHQRSLDDTILKLCQCRYVCIWGGQITTRSRLGWQCSLLQPAAPATVTELYVYSRWVSSVSMGCLKWAVHVTTTVRTHLSECWGPKNARITELLSEQYCLDAKQNFLPPSQWSHSLQKPSSDTVLKLAWTSDGTKILWYVSVHKHRSTETYHKISGVQIFDFLLIYVQKRYWGMYPGNTFHYWPQLC